MGRGERNKTKGINFKKGTEKVVRENIYYVNCYYTNAQSINNKLSEFELNIDTFRPKIIGITESWCREGGTLEGAISLPEYEMFRDDREIGRGGGVLLYIHDSLKPKKFKELENHGFENSVWAEICLGGGDTLLVGLCYHSPNSSAANSELLMDLLNRVKNQGGYTHLLLMGDFNFPKIKWDRYYVGAGENSMSYRFFDLTQDMFLFQHVDFATRIREGQHPSIVDLIFTNEEYMVDGLRSCAPLGKSDHISMVFAFVCYSNPYKEKRKSNMRDYFKANYQTCRREMGGIDWRESLRGKGVNQSWKFFKAKYREVERQHVPLKSEKNKSCKPPYLRGSRAKTSIKRKYALWQRYRRTGRTRDRREYNRQRNETNRLLKTLEREHEKKLIKNFKRKPKAFYGYIRDKQKVKVNVPDLERSEGRGRTGSDGEAAGETCRFFKSVFVEEGEGELPNFEDRVAEGESLRDIEITEQNVEDRLSKLKEDKAMGPDGIHPKFLKECAHEVALPLYIIYRKSLDMGVLPIDWKMARVIPIHKKGSRSNPGNYRPVSLTCIACKVLEGLLRDEILKYLKEKNLIAVGQHGFLEGKSCLTNLLETLEDWTAALDEGYWVDSVFLDYQKAFDTVPHRRLIHKLRAYGIKGRVVGWIESFLWERKMQVCIGEGFSEWVGVSSGVPQGSVLGPLLFLLYVNELPEIVKCKIQMFADDTKVYKEVSGSNEQMELQEDLDRLSDWAEDWLLAFNVNKCKRMHMGHNNPRNAYSMRTPGGQVILEEISEEKDLGVWLTNNLKTSMQCNKAAAKAMSTLAVIRKSFSYLDIDSFRIIYRTYIRPHMEYCVQAWNPYLIKDIKCLEKIQKRATSLVPNIQRYSYEERLKILDLYSLERRRERGDLIETFKILKGLENVDREKWFNLSGNVNLRGHRLKIEKPRARLNIRKFFFSHRIVNAWNRLPNYIIEKETVQSFKTELDKYWCINGYGYRTCL